MKANLHRQDDARAKRFALAAAGDAASAALALGGHPVPGGLLMEAAAQASRSLAPRWLRQSTFLNDAGPWWDWYPSAFASEECLELPYRARRYRLPYVLVLAPKAPMLGVRRSRTEFVLGEDIASFTEEALTLQERRRRVLGKWFSDQPLLRVSRFQLQPQPLIQVQEVSYRTTLRTNLSLDYCKRGMLSLRSYVHGDRLLPPFDSSRLGDHIGVNSLVFTADGKLVINRRSRRTGLRVGEWAPSSSGAVSARDARVGHARVSLMDWFRETVEERGLRHRDVEADAFLGLARELIRGGKPELFFLVHTRLSESALSARLRGARDRSEWAGRTAATWFAGEPLSSVEGGQSTQMFLNQLDRFLDRFGDLASWPLLAALALWTRLRVGCSI